MIFQIIIFFPIFNYKFESNKVIKERIKFSFEKIKILIKKGKKASQKIIKYDLYQYKLNFSLHYRY